jgi:hypothetical protein
MTCGAFEGFLARASGYVLEEVVSERTNHESTILESSSVTRYP